MNAYRITIPFTFLKPFFLITTGIVPPFLYSQQDCFSAINISYDTTLHFPFIQGYGKMKEITGHTLGDSIYFPEETSSCWFRITPFIPSILEFHLTPSIPEDDWDFILFQSEKNQCLDKIPVRSNIAGKIKHKKNNTGLDSTGTKFFVPSGPNFPFSKPLLVEPGNTYYLVVNNYSRSGHGFTITFRFHKIHAPSLPPPLPHDTASAPTPSYPFHLMVCSKTSGKKIKATLTLASPSKLFNQFVTQDTVLYPDSLYEKEIELLCMAPGFMPYYEKFILKKTANKHIIYLIPLQRGKSISFENLEFYGNSSKLKENSSLILQLIEQTMILNPSLKILIEGHVNGPDSRNTRAFKKLSKERAKSIKNYLIEKGIASYRIVTKGWGNKKMIYKNPRNEAQHRANRRVEIKVLEY